MMALILATAISAVGISYVGVGWFRRWAERRRILDVPNERSSHTQPTPRGGGLVIAGLTLLLGFFLVALLGNESHRRLFFSYAAGALLITAVSWLDDLHPLPSWARLAAHAAGAGLAIAGTGYWQELRLPFLGLVWFGHLGSGITLLWIIGLTNAYNFMDGIDGIAGGQAVVAGLGWGLLVWEGSALVNGLGLLVAAASLGFLLHNWPPARIFMGDAGSAFLGYTLAILPLLLSASKVNEAVAGSALVIGITFVWPFVFDTMATFLRRFCKGENVFQAHHSHLYQRLVTAGWSHRMVTLLYIGLSVVGAWVGYSWAFRALGGDFTRLSILPVMAALLWILVISQERRQASVRTRAVKD
jgi:UDP-N-acetylmuramyl pentapeptide phosphotransferase/UDP-N-acetylglucosamine-1-phosphate transferase